MPELGPYGSMRGEVRENLPYRDDGTGKSVLFRLMHKGSCDIYLLFGNDSITSTIRIGHADRFKENQGTPDTRSRSLCHISE